MPSEHYRTSQRQELYTAYTSASIKDRFTLFTARQCVKIEDVTAIMRCPREPSTTAAFAAGSGADRMMASMYIFKQDRLAGLSEVETRPTGKSSVHNQEKDD